jgi:hypothetical protein
MQFVQHCEGLCLWSRDFAMICNFRGYREWGRFHDISDRSHNHFPLTRLLRTCIFIMKDGFCDVASHTTGRELV